MSFDILRKAVEDHSGVFSCTKIGDETEKKEVAFRHEYASPAVCESEFPIECLREFYETFSSLKLYHEPVSDDAAFYIGAPSEWDLLEHGFRSWLVDLYDDEVASLPNWIENCVVFGEIPQSGNYFLTPSEGEKYGFVFEFEHDGFEFIEHAPNIEKFILNLLDPDESALTGMASHMSFVEGDEHSTQWWITEMQDNRGNVVRTYE